MYRPIIGTLGYVLSEDRKRTLLIHRNSRNDDHHLNKYNGLGGKMLPEEDVVSCLNREIHEEAGIRSEEIILRGTINWTGFGPEGENWLGFIFRVDRFSGWEGDRFFLPMVFDDDPRIFHGYMPYKNGLPLSWDYVRI
jgi:8-oxo-dGTP diphosphatase